MYIELGTSVSPPPPLLQRAAPTPGLDGWTALSCSATIRHVWYPLGMVCAYVHPGMYVGVFFSSVFKKKKKKISFSRRVQSTLQGHVWVWWWWWWWWLVVVGGGGMIEGKKKGKGKSYAFEGGTHARVWGLGVTD